MFKALHSLCFDGDASVSSTPLQERKRTMKIQCPYCHKVSEWPATAKCPECGKTSLPKGFFARSGKVKKTARRRERDIQPTQPWIMSGKLMGFFLIWTRIPRWVIWLCGLAIIGAVVYAPRYKVDFPELRKAATESLTILNVALDMFKEDCGRYPTEEEGLEALVSMKTPPDGWRGPYIRKLKKDPWSKRYIYHADKDGRHIKLLSGGPDGREGGNDDILPDLRKQEPEGPREVEVLIGPEAATPPPPAK